MTDKELLFNKTFCILFDVGCDDTYNPDFNLYADMKNMYDNIKRNTQINDDGIFTTTFTTCMYNTIMDFGETAAYLNLALDTCCNKIKLIDREIESNFP